MTRMKNALGAALLLIPFAAGATTSYTFDSVSKIQYGGGGNANPGLGVFVTGVLSGDSAPTTVGFPDTASSCHDFYNQMLQVSGKYRLTVTTDVLAPPGMPSSTTLYSCSLELKP